MTIKTKALPPHGEPEARGPGALLSKRHPEKSGSDTAKKTICFFRCRKNVVHLISANHISTQLITFHFNSTQLIAFQLSSTHCISTQLNSSHFNSAQLITFHSYNTKMTATCHRMIMRFGVTHSPAELLPPAVILSIYLQAEPNLPIDF